MTRIPTATATATAESTLVSIKQALATLSANVATLERQVAKMVDAKTASLPVETAILKERLKSLTLKRHAVLTATLGGKTYLQISELMQSNVTTVKLQLKGTLRILQIPSRDHLRTAHNDLLKPFSDREYEELYGIGKSWWLERKPALMVVLTAVKAAGNQHTLIGKRPASE